MIDLQSIILTYVNNFSYFGVFLILAIIALVPIPEELVLLLVGYFAGFGFADLKLIIPISILGVTVGDNILFFLSRHSSHYINKFKKKIAPKRFLKYENYMKLHIKKSIFLLRFIIGLRFLGPVMAGHLKVKWKTFFLYNLLAVLIFVPILVFLGYHFNTILSLVIEDITFIKKAVFIALLTIIIISIIHIIRNKFKNNGKNNKK